jgi:limonene-1,2-epoxide hydrolase
MKPFILYILIAAFSSACSSPAEKSPAADTAPATDTSSAAVKTAPADKTSEENLTLVNNFFAAVEKLDTAAMSALLADNYHGYGPSIGDSAGKAEILGNWKYNFDHFYASIKYNRYQNIASNMSGNSDAEPGDWVSNWSYCSIKYRDGRGPIYIWVNSVYKIENGKIVKSRVIYNEADWLRQLGYRLIKPIQKKQGESL